MPQQFGPIIIDLLGYEITQEERELLQHPLVVGIILFARNYESPQQLIELCRTIRAARKTPLLITADQEGGRVQRFKDGFMRLPSLGQISKLYHESPDEGVRFAHDCGWLMAAEVLAAGVDLSLAPVLDLDKKLNTVIGDRSFDSDPAIVRLLAKAMIAGMREAGMAATGKHFPGHGSVNLDSHLALPEDTRDFNEIYQNDMQPFIELMNTELTAIMPAHIIFPKVDDKPVSFSGHWLKDILRKKLNFTGVVISDDLNMGGAKFAGGPAERAQSALEAGCDIVLMCNNRNGAIEILDRLPEHYSLAAEKFNCLKGKFTTDWSSLHASHAWKNYRKVYENYA
jgi:beta-N-acetylhexosaminidase